jgi:hypothetical protein
MNVISKDNIKLEELDNGDWLLILPEEFAEEHGFVEGATVKITAKENMIIIELVK